MELEDIMLSEISQAQKGKYCTSSAHVEAKGLISYKGREQWSLEDGEG
jgi:hypothetical protein